MIPVTKPYFPNKEKYLQYVSQIFDRQWLTNNGPLVEEFESKLRTTLNVENLLVLGNGTIALQLAIKALKLQGEIITTPFSYVATTSSIVWEGCSPVFADIDGETLNLDPDTIESLITEKTSAILATHCFGNACNIEAINRIADKHNLKVIYDAAHCFGTKYKGKSIFDYGDISTCSLHATKLIHSVEGGFVVTKTPTDIERVSYMRNFGHDGFDKFNGVGINGKNSEVHAAMGLCVLQDIDLIMHKRKEQSKAYDNYLNFSRIQKPIIQENCDFNYSYYPILFKDEQTTLKVKKDLENNDIFPRRYFYPSLNLLGYLRKSSTPVSEQCASRILCLPIYHELSLNDQIRISQIINEII